MERSVKIERYEIEGKRFIGIPFALVDVKGKAPPIYIPMIYPDECTLDPEELGMLNQIISMERYLIDETDKCKAYEFLKNKKNIDPQEYEWILGEIKNQEEKIAKLTKILENSRDHQFVCKVYRKMVVCALSNQNLPAFALNFILGRLGEISMNNNCTSLLGLSPAKDGKPLAEDIVWAKYCVVYSLMRDCGVGEIKAATSFQESYEETLGAYTRRIKRLEKSDNCQLKLEQKMVKEIQWLLNHGVNMAYGSGYELLKNIVQAQWPK